ncbi:MAG: pyruvate formate lyase family protein [Candidatus Hodarchaeota archaeon]
MSAVFEFGLKLMGLKFKLSKKFRKEIYNPENDYKFNAKIQITTRNGDNNIYAIFKDGKMKSGKGKIENPDLTLVYRNKKILASAVSSGSSLDKLLNGDLYLIGSMATSTKFEYITTLFPKKIKEPLSKSFAPKTKITEEQSEIKKINNVILDKKVDNVKYLKDPYLGGLGIRDFPRLHYLKNWWFSEHPEMDVERAKNITEFFRNEGFEKDKNGKPWNPSLRQGLMLKYILSKKAPKIFGRDLIPGSTTSKKIGVQLYPEFSGTLIWPELRTVMSRRFNPYLISEEERNILNDYVFPFWMERNVREYTRKKHGNPACQRFDEYFVLYFMWKLYAISHTIPDWNILLGNGLTRVIEEIQEKEKEAKDDDKKSFYQGMSASLEGVLIYADNLKKEAIRQVKAQELKEVDGVKKRLYELEDIVAVLENVPANPAKTFREAITAVWITWLSLHQENMNAGLSLGRLDQTLYPYFENDMKAAKTDEEREKKILEIIELVGAFYMKCGDHLPLVPNIGNKLFGGSSSDQALTLGGVTPDGENAVNDLTYIFLKVTEMLTLRDPNMNARYHTGKNSIEYLKRLCEVNINTTSTPSIHNDEAMIEVLQKYGFKLEDARTWAATGCVEPTLCGKHFGHTNCMLLNLVAPLEILMNNGHHPLIHLPINENLTPEFNSQNYLNFEDFLEGYKKQLAFVIQNSITFNNILGEVHQELHPTPLLSSLFNGPLEKGRDLVHGSAIYNSSGVALVALADVVDSLLSIKKVVYDEKKTTLKDLKATLDRDFQGENDKILLEHVKKVPKFGSNDAESNALAKSLIEFMNDEYAKVDNYRGGKYLVGFWSMSNHTAFGKLSSALPSGRLSGKAFTPGITPAPGSSDQLLENIKTVAQVDNFKTPNNIAFNVKLVPGPNDTHEQTLENFVNYTKSYFDLGGLQMQFNVVTSDMLREAMDHPEKYRWLMVRISGYNAYFISLNKDMQRELVERYEFQA